MGDGKFKSGHKLSKGRPKGSKNLHTFNSEELAKEMGVDPLRFLLEVVAGLHPEYDDQRVTAAKEACKYLYSAKQAVALSAGDSGIKIIVEDYCTKK